MGILSVRLSGQSAQRDALADGKPHRASARQRDSVLQPVVNVGLLDRSADTASEGALTPRDLNGLTECGDGATALHGEPSYKRICNDTTKTFGTQYAKILCMQTLGDVVKTLRELRGWNQSELARRASTPMLRVSPQNIQGLEAGGVGQPRYLPGLASAFDMSIDQLLAYPHEVTAPIRFSKSAPDFFERMKPITVWENADDLPADAFVELPRISLRLSGGKGAPSRDHIEKFDTGQAFRADFAARMKWKPSTHYSMICEGHSMEPTIMHRAPVVVDTTQKSIKSGQIYAIVIDDEPRLKRLDKLPGGMVRVRSDNTASREYDPYEVREADLEIIGRAVWTASLL